MTTIVFIQVHGQPALTEMQLGENATFEQLEDQLRTIGVDLDRDTLIFLDEEDEPLDRKRHKSLPPIKQGCRIQVTKCRKIRVTVNFLDKSAEHDFAPSHRVKKVKSWAVEKFGLDRNDAAEHVLQMCGSTDRPTTDTPLQQIALPGTCSVCFDLVPDKRVEG